MQIEAHISTALLLPSALFIYGGNSNEEKAAIPHEKKYYSAYVTLMYFH